MSLADRSRFSKLCALLENIQKVSGSKQKKKLLEKYINEWRGDGEQFYPLLRLLVPHVDKERNTYGIKEKTLATIYIDILSIGQTADADVLSHWRRHADTGGNASDFATILFRTLEARSGGRQGTGMSISQINEKLDQLNKTEGMAEKKPIFRHFLTNCSPLEQKWIARIILKEMKIGITEASVFHVWHPEAAEMYNVTSSLKQVAMELTDPNIMVMNKGIKLWAPFKPMLSKSCKAIEDVEKIFKGHKFWIQTKLDGERIQMHKSGNKYRWYSRQAKDYTPLYGEHGREKFAMSIHDCFHSNVTDCILDGELLSFSTETGTVEGFGALKGAARQINEDGEANAKSRPYFLVFDCVYINGKTIDQSPLKDRYEVLKRIFEPRKDFFEVLEYQEASTSAEVTDALDLRMLRHEEGIIIKNPNAPYACNERGDDSLKLKPDYITHWGNDLDLVLVGGFYGTGYRAGRLSHFMLAVVDKTDPDKPRYVSFCKIGSGYTYSAIDDISKESEGNWIPYDPKRIPSWFTHHPNSKEKPDKILPPQHSHVLCVKAAEIVPSDQYAAGVTLRFPRFVRIRDDKDLDQAMTTDELREYIKKDKGRMQSRRSGGDDVALVKAKEEGKKAGRVRTVATVPAEYRADLRGVVPVDQIFHGLEFCVIVGAVPGPDGACQKHAVEREVVRHGGRCTQNPSFGRTDFVVADKIIAKVSSLINSYDIIKTLWIRDCIKQGHMVPLQPRHALSATEKLKATFKESNDAFGDSYTENITLGALKELFQNMGSGTKHKASEDGARDGDESRGRKGSMRRLRDLRAIAAAEERYFDAVPLMGSLFRRFSIYLDVHERIYVARDLMEAPPPQGVVVVDCHEDPPPPPEGHHSSLETLSSSIRCWGGHVTSVLTADTTHVVVGTLDDLPRRDPKTRASEFTAVLVRVRGRHTRRINVVVSEWIRASIEEQIELPVEDFDPFVL